MTLTRRRAATDLDELAFLSGAAQRLAEESFSEDDVHRLVAEQVACITPDSLIATARFVPSLDATVVRAIAGPPDLLATAREALGQELIGLTFRVNEEARRGLTEGRLLRLEGGLHQLVFEAWDPGWSHQLEARLGIQSVYVQAFARRGDFLGTVSVISLAPRLAHPTLVEAFVRLAAVVIQRRRFELRVRESEHMLSMLADNSPDVIFKLQLVPTPRFEFVSPAAVQVIGRAPQELYARWELGAGCLFPEAWTSAVPGDVPTDLVSVRCTRRDDTDVWVEQKLTPLRNEEGQVVAVEGIARDVTSRRAAEDALVETDRRKNEFLAVLSHELRNPLSPIRNGVYLLEHSDPTSDRAKRAREVIARQVDHLTRIVDDLLDVTRITRGKIQLQRRPVDLNQLILATIDDHRPIFARAQIELDVAIGADALWVDADSTRLAQLVGNLLLNAAKFTPAGGRTSVSVDADRDAGRAVLRVRDTGIGIAPELLPHLFEPFAQADTSLERTTGGLGLGLVIARGLAELHDGSVSAESPGVGMGTLVTVQLPLGAAGARVDGPRPIAEPRSRRVLVIEDNLDAADTLRDLLELTSHTVAVAYTGPEGVAQARAFRPDVVLCDIGLPEMNGYEVARAIRKVPELQDVALVALTGYASAEDIERARIAGFDRHVSKPPTADTIRRVIVELVPETPEGRVTRGGPHLVAR